MPVSEHASDTLAEKVFVGSIKSNKYHYPSCEWAQKIKPENEIWFSSSADARSHGYVPCKVCNPP
jgi:micrococcal nuclease